MDASAGYNTFTVAIVLNVRGRVIWPVVDSVSDALSLGRDDIKAAPNMSASVESGNPFGIGCTTEADTNLILILVDIEALSSSQEIGLIERPIANQLPASCPAPYTLIDQFDIEATRAVLSFFNLKVDSRGH